MERAETDTRGSSHEDGKEWEGGSVFHCPHCGSLGVVVGGRETTSRAADQDVRSALIQNRGNEELRILIV